MRKMAPRIKRCRLLGEERAWRILGIVKYPRQNASATFSYAFNIPSGKVLFTMRSAGHMVIQTSLLNSTLA
jgi:hypothetical protein